ncbi:AAA family ATPase [Methylobacterium hispanicum]|uniref:AAA family ATPase n=1 Tax=Methylobacterium hispanicum TaxID=270350 RepID=UPI001EE030DA|nr:AAA family ATPase [Methylobacterium hispanicum]
MFEDIERWSGEALLRIETMLRAGWDDDVLPVFVAARADDIPGRISRMLADAPIGEAAGHPAALKRLVATEVAESLLTELKVAATTRATALAALSALFGSPKVPSDPYEMRLLGLRALTDVTDWSDGRSFADYVQRSLGTSRAGDRPTRIVVREIGGANDSRGIADIYAPLTRPLPLGGGHLDPRDIAAELMEEMPWFRHAIARLRNDLRIAHFADRPYLKFRPLLLVGPAGVGKSRFARRLAQIAGVGYRYLNAGGKSSGADFVGNGRSHEAPTPCAPVEAIFRSRFANPIMFVDEIDKAAKNLAAGKLEDALLAVLEPETARRYYDECLQADVDLFYVNYMLAANDRMNINDIMRSRVSVETVEKPPADAFPQIARSIMNEVAADYGLDPASMPGAWEFTKAEYEFKAGRSIRVIKRMMIDMLPEILGAQLRPAAHESVAAAI